MIFNSPLDGSRNPFAKYVVFLMFGVCLPGFNGVMVAQRPNIVFVMVDDMGFGELGVTGQLARAANGQKHIDTPNIDSLATAGLLMNHFYATPICASTRAALLTGYHNGHSPVDRNGGNNGGNAIRKADITIGETLKSAGYATGAFGKWGIGGFDHNVAGVNVSNASTATINFPDAIPTAHGFDEFYGYLNQVRAHSYYQTFQWEQDGSGGLQVHPTSTVDYSADLIANRSLDFISNHANTGTPFFMYGAYTLPHGNFDPPSDAILQSYLSAGYTLGEANYAAMMARVDNTMGDIVARLKDPNQDGNSSDSVYDDTLILFTSDNGGTPGENNYFDGGAGFRSVKGNTYEGGIRAPLIAHWNGKIAPGQIDDTNIASVDDMLATFAGLAGAEIPMGVDSADVSGLFTGSAVEDRHFHVFEARNKNDYSIRMGDYKLVSTGGSSELYNVVTDPGESNNIAGSNAAIAILMEQIALDEGTRADAGTSVSQTTHIVQYKAWTPMGGSTDWSNDGNWLGGTATNTRGVAVNNFNTGPANNWVVTVDNTSTGARESVISGNSTVLGLEVAGSSAAMSVKVSAGRILQARNGVRIRSGGQMELDNGTLQTLRTVDIRQDGTLKAAGNIHPIYDTSGTPFQLYATVKNGGRLEVGAESSVATKSIELATNTSFELGSGNSFAATSDWANYGGNDALNGRNTSNPSTGTYRAIVGVSGGNEPVSPTQNTNHAIELGDEFTLSFDYAGASAWDLGSDSFRVSVFYDDNGNDTNLFATSVTPTLNFANGYSTFDTTIPPIADADAVGKQLQVRFESLAGTSEFASIDQFSLATTGSTVASNVLNLEGNYDQSENGVLAINIDGSGLTAGVDFDQFAISGSADLLGELEVTVDPGLTLNLMQSVEILVAADGIGGKFAKVTGVGVADGTGLAVTYSANAVSVVAALPGDADLDGDVDTSDFDIWNAHRFSAGVMCWEQGDFNGDGFTDVSDFNIWNTHRGMSVAALSVPEPSAWYWMFGFLPLWLRRSRSARIETAAAKACKATGVG